MSHWGGLTCSAHGIRQRAPRAEKLLDSSPDFSKMDINSLLEFHHINQYFQNDIFLDHWSLEQKANYLEIVRLALSEIRNYFLALAPDETAAVIENLEFQNRQSFWELFRYFEIYKKTDPKIFAQILTAYPNHIRYVLKLKQVVGYYDSEVRLFLLNYSESAELLLSHYEEKHTNEEDVYIFPKSLSFADKHAIIDTYLDSVDPNLNFVELVRNSKHLKLPAKILLKAKRKAEYLQEKHFTEENSTKICVSATLDITQKEAVIFLDKSGETNVVYGGLFLDTLANNVEVIEVFQNLFHYIDSEGMVTLINKPTEMDNLEMVFMRSKNEYQEGFAFSHKNMLSIAQLGIISHYFDKKGQSIEGVVQGFVQQFFKMIYPIEGIAFNMPESKAAPSDKIRLLAPEMEYLLKQFKNFVTDGFIDHDLLQIDSMPIFFSEIPSLVDKKYVYSSHQTIQKIQIFFFDRHSIIKIRSKSKKKKNLFQTLATEYILQSDLEDYQLTFVNHLVQEELLEIKEDSSIKMVNPLLVFIAGKLKENGCMSYWHHPLAIRTEIDRLIDEGILKSSDKLFTRNEISYLNYYLK